MFREMRRSKQALTAEEVAEILKRNTSGVLAVSGDGGYPYAVPLSYVYLDSKLYFHCAGTGHKLDSILKDDKVSFCVIDQDQVVGEEYTTYFRSVVAFGRARVLGGGGETAAPGGAVREILSRSSGADPSKGRGCAEKCLHRGSCH